MTNNSKKTSKATSQPGSSATNQEVKSKKETIAKPSSQIIPKPHNNEENRKEDEVEDMDLDEFPVLTPSIRNSGIPRLFNDPNLIDEVKIFLPTEVQKNKETEKGKQHESIIKSSTHVEHIVVSPSPIQLQPVTTMMKEKSLETEEIETRNIISLNRETIRSVASSSDPSAIEKMQNLKHQNQALLETLQQIAKRA